MSNFLVGLSKILRNYSQIRNVLYNKNLRSLQQYIDMSRDQVACKGGSCKRRREGSAFFFFFCQPAFSAEQKSQPFQTPTPHPHLSVCHPPPPPFCLCSSESTGNRPKNNQHLVNLLLSSGKCTENRFTVGTKSQRIRKKITRNSFLISYCFYCQAPSGIDHRLR